MFAPLNYSSFFIHHKQETLGVPVVTYGETQDFPAFYTPDSGFKVGLRFPVLIPQCTQLPLISEPVESERSSFRCQNSLYVAHEILSWLFLKILSL